MKKHAHRLCPVWIGYFLASPLRKLHHRPVKILGPHVRAGMRVVDIGCGMGFFSLPMARLVGPHGRVFCVDLQEKMLRVLSARARRVGWAERIETRTCQAESLGLEDLRGRIDLVLAFAVVHEAPDPAHFLAEIADALNGGGRLLMAEPRGHVSADEFQETITAAETAGLRVIESLKIPRSRAILMARD